MSKEKSDFKFWKRISEYIKDNKYTYIDSDKYNDLISQVALKVYNLRHGEGFTNTYDYFKQRHETKKTFIYEVLEDILCNNDFEPALHILNVIQNKEIIEEALNTISVQLTNKDYEFPTHNDYSKKINNFKNQAVDKTKKNHSYENNNLSIPHPNRSTMSNKQALNTNPNIDAYKDKKFNIHMVHNNLYDEIVINGLNIWRDGYSNNLFYRIKPYDEMIKTDKIKLADYLSQLFNRSIDIYLDTKDIKYQKTDFLIVSLLLIVKKEVYDPLNHNEFIYIQNNMYYKNTFRYTKFLEKRLNPNYQYQSTINRNNTVVRFIEELSLDQQQSESIINWIASFFQLMRKNNTALVLIGDNETTEILVNNIIKPIFAFKENDYCLVCNNTLKNIDELSLQNKILYHIDDISTASANNTKPSKIVKQLLKTQTTYYEAIERNIPHYHGQLIITADKHDPYPYLKDSYSRCMVFQVKNFRTILKNFQMEPIELEESIDNDLDKFCNLLSTYNFNFAYLTQTKEKKLLENNNFNKIKQHEVSSFEIKVFIDAIKNHKYKKSYFDPIKVDKELYDELMYNFEENMVARPVLYKYFNMIHQEEVFTNNEELLKILRGEDKFFEQNIDKNKQYKRKKRYILPEQTVEKKHTKIVRRRKLRIVKKTKPKKITRYVDKYKNKKSHNKNNPPKKTSIYHKLFKK